MTTVDGTRVSEGEIIEVGFEIGAARTLLGKHLAARGNALVSSWETDWSMHRGESRGHFV
jgi:hypothetical protein